VAAQRRDDDDDEEARVIRSWRAGTMPRRIVIAAAAALVPLIAGCDAGANAPSLQWHAPTDGATTTIGNITVSNAFLLGGPLSSALRPGQNASFFFGLTNTGTHLDKLIRVSAPGVAQSVLLPGGRVTVNSEHSVLLTGPRPQVILEHLLRPLSGGSVVTLVLTFQEAGQVKLQVPVMPRAQYYSTLSPPATPTSTPSPAVSPSTPIASPTPSARHHSKHHSPTPSPSVSP
jgi:copper(I)-binding protein